MGINTNSKITSFEEMINAEETAPVAEVVAAVPTTEAVVEPVTTTEGDVEVAEDATGA
jgi:hypothetical protein